MLSKEEIKNIFKKEDLKILKSLGQNFLIDEKVLKKIIICSDLNSDDVVFEIGPGLGILTKELSEKCRKVVSIEKDVKISQMLKNKFENVEVINNDILQINIRELVQKYSENGKFKLVSNIPYYITSPIIKLFLENDVLPKIIVLLTQKEVAERICAKPGKLSMIALGVQTYGEPKIIDFVKNTSFYPCPKVDSAILKIIDIKRDFSKEYYKNLFRIMKIGFSAKRKKLVNNLSSGLQLDKKQSEEILSYAEIDLKARAQELGLDDWKKLSEIIQRK
ncbi:MAG: ribosomal RNA small subunit methyltransferase A [Candidatus Pacebacteria bacterium]|nr:ribosomal RNA small subunit methyltransferase A [Candidatus Paceibacterota bacterium]